MTKICVLFAVFLLFILFFQVSGQASGTEVEVVGPEVRLVSDNILVTTGMTLDEKNLNDLKNGIAKEITFHVDLYRVWKNWPDEFISGKKIVKTITGDLIKKEYVATSFDGTTLVKKRFRDLDSMLAWTLSIGSQELVNVRELQLADYFVKVTAESRLRTLPPVIGYLLFFVPEKEFKVTKNSSVFTVGNPK